MKRAHRRSCACGWSGSYTTAGYADKALRLHSCDEDWSPRPCSHDGRHRHGEAVTYKHCGCRCAPCRTAVADLEVTNERARAYGRTRYVDAGPAREHVNRLREVGMGWPRIVALSGVDPSVLRRLIWGKKRNGRREVSQRISRQTEAALLAVTYDPADGGGPVDGGATARRLRALVALGYWPSLLAHEAGYNQAYLDRLIRARDDRRVRPGTARRVHELFRSLATTTPPSGPYAERARRLAAERGWRPPIRIGGRVLVGAPIGDVA